MTARTLTDLTWIDVPERPLVLVPVGSTEQHGPHLPLSTDTLIAEAVAHAAAPAAGEALGVDVVVGPVIMTGASGEHQAFAGTVSIGHDALRMLLVEIVRSLSTWAGRTVFVNGHGGNVAMLSEVVRQMRAERHDVSAVSCTLESATDAHAGHHETCVMLHLHPELVDMSRAEAGNTEPLAALLPRLMAEGVRPVSPNGILGDPVGATGEIGARVFGELVDGVVRKITDG